MKIRLVRVDNQLIDVSTWSEPGEIPGNAEIELRSIMPLVVGSKLPMRPKPPYFKRAEVERGKVTLESTVGLMDLPEQIRELWWKFEKAVVSWAEKEVNDGKDS